ncbi:MAG: hypothetical protein A3F10_01120 [Coxiella sp. RIFCSPHIGHO2_12_FULL_42_15]|nr:MAG: hypothetical protein A3F10_01120 [Coxiella sp. RIFCSPHIGHO2_12_FULL_42_15]
MMKKIILTSAVFSLSFTSIALCAEDKTAKDNRIFSDPSKTILVKKENPTFTLNLRSNPTTGFIWVLQGDYSHDMISAVNHAFHAPDSKLLGAPGYESFEFKMSGGAFVVPQVTQLTLYYMRPWVVANHPQKMTFTIVSVSGIN